MHAFLLTRTCVTPRLRARHPSRGTSADGVFIGPYDLSLALGFPPPSPDPHPEVEKVIQKILAAAHARGKKWCAPFLPPPIFPSLSRTSRKALAPISSPWAALFTARRARRPPSARKKVSTWCVSVFPLIGLQTAKLHVAHRSTSLRTAVR